MEKVCVLGAGSWGTALALVVAKKGYSVSMWTLNEEQCNKINKDKEKLCEMKLSAEEFEEMLYTKNISII
jgi:glycerol-3-phosphate dehydrogenase